MLSLRIKARHLTVGTSAIDSRVTLDHNSYLITVCPVRAGAEPGSPKVSRETKSVKRMGRSGQLATVS